MIVYQLTEEQYRALLKDLELAKFNTPDGLCVTPLAREAQMAGVEAMHRRFRYCVITALGGIAP